MKEFIYTVTYADPTGTDKLVFSSVAEIVDYLMSVQGYSLGGAVAFARASDSAKKVSFDNSEDQTNPFNLTIEKEFK